MPWPKGKKRKGHIKKDGKPASKAGRKVYMSPAAAMRTLSAIVSQTNSSDTGTPMDLSSARAKLKDASTTVASSVRVEGTSKAHSQSPESVQTETPEAPVKVWGIKSQPVIESCTKCGYAYADGGYCPECGQTTPIRIGVRIY